jgi:hypothetical protein
MAAEPVACDPKVFDEALMDNGHMALQKVLQKSPTMQEPIDQGMKMIIIRNEVEDACPRLPGFLQEAGNANRNLDNKPNRIQVMLQILNKLVCGVNPETVAATIEQEYEWLDGDGESLTAYARAWSGGDDGKFLKDCDEYCKTLQNVADPPTSVLNAMARLKKSDAAILVTAILKAMMASPEQYTAKSNRSTLISPSDVNSIQLPKQRDASERVMEFMRAAIDHCNALVAAGASASECARHRGEMEVRMVWLMFGKKPRGYVVPSGFKEIADDFLRKIPVIKGVKAPWKTAPCKKQDVSVQPVVVAPAASEEVVRAFDAHGTAVLSNAAFAQSGFVVDAIVRSKKDKESNHLKIAAIDDSSVTLTSMSPDGNSTVIKRHELLDGYDIIRAKFEHIVVKLDNSATMPEIQEMCFKAKTALALRDLWQRHYADVSVSIRVNAPRAVIAAKDYEPFCLVLVPLSSSLKCVASIKMATQRDVVMTAKTVLRGAGTIIRPAAPPLVTEKNITDCPTCITPFWCVGAGTENVNMHLVDTVQDDVTIPTLQNFVPVKKGDVLIVATIEKDDPAVPQGKGKGKGKGKGRVGEPAAKRAKA